MKAAWFQFALTFFNKNLKFLLVLLPFAIILLAFPFYYKSPLNLIQYCLDDSQDKQLYYGIFDDRKSGGNSVGEEIKTTDKIVFRYTLKKGVEYPFSGITFYPINPRFVDLSGFDEIKLKLKAKEGKRLKLAIGTNIQNYSRDEDFNSYKNNQVIINSDKDFNEITTDFSILETPEWWFTINQKTENEIGKSDYSKVHYINISNCLSIPLDKEDHIEIEELIFYKSLIPFILYAAVGCLAYYIFLFFLFRKKEKAVVPVQFTYEKTEVLNHFEKEEEAVFQYITSNYSNPELSILDVVNATGIYEQKVSSMIKKKTEMNFKQFLNSLRIAEAKRLLKTSDLQISEIAYKVGYGNVSHFNRVFKESEQCSPNDFRKQDQKSTIS